MARRMLFLAMMVGLLGGTTWLIFFILNITVGTPWPDWLPH